MRFINAKVYTPDFTFQTGGFGVEEGRFVSVLEDGGPKGEDLSGAYVIPGAIDIHCHGNSGVDFQRCKSPEDLAKVGRFLARNGVTSFLFTTGSDYEDVLAETYTQARRFMEDTPADCAYIHGMHMEGPFFSEAKKGAHNSKHLRVPDFDMFMRLHEVTGNNILITCLAAEFDNSVQFIEQAKSVARVSIAHSNAGYVAARAAFDAGASHLTHLYNGMSPLAHREPGVIGAAADSPGVMVELICDGIHVHECAVRIAYKIFTPERIILISDNTPYCGLPDGEYGDNLVVRDKTTWLKDGTLSGTGICLFEGMTRVASFGIPLEEAVRCATYNPAKAIGVLDKTGTIENGKYADFVVCNEDLCVLAVYVKGRKII